MALETRAKVISMMDPRVEAEQVQASMAPRPHTLGGKVMALLDNSKANADKLIKLVGELIGEKYEIKGVKAAQKPDSSRPAPKELLDRLAEECDFAVVAVGD